MAKNSHNQKRFAPKLKIKKGASKDRAVASDPSLETGMKRYRVAVGYKDKVKPGNIVGAIANEAGIQSSLIGRIEIKELFSLVDISSEVSDGIIQGLQNTMVAGRPIQIREWVERPDSNRKGKKSFKKGSKKGRKKRA